MLKLQDRIITLSTCNTLQYSLLHCNVVRRESFLFHYSTILLFHYSIIAYSGFYCVPCFPFFLLPVIWQMLNSGWQGPSGMWSVNKFLMKCGQLSENPLSLPRHANSSCGMAGRLFLLDKLFSFYWRLHRFINTVTTNRAINFMVHSIYRICYTSVASFQNSSLKKLWFITSTNKCLSCIVANVVQWPGWKVARKK